MFLQKVQKTCNFGPFWRQNHKVGHGQLLRVRRACNNRVPIATTQYHARRVSLWRTVVTRLLSALVTTAGCQGCITERGQPCPWPCRCHWSQYRSCHYSRGMMQDRPQNIGLGLLSNWIACTEITKKQTNVFYFLFIFCYYFFKV